MNVTPLKQPARDHGRWYAVPPCNGRGWNVPDWERSWHIVNEAGELVATFEAREAIERAAVVIESAAPEPSS